MDSKKVIKLSDAGQLKKRKCQLTLDPRVKKDFRALAYPRAHGPLR